MALLAVLPFVHDLLKRHLRAGDWAVDGTAGNGHDTLLLAQCVGDGGCVWAFDVQDAAIDATLARLQQHGCAAQVRLHKLGHEHMASVVPQGIAAAVFNFGYLPKGDKSITTQAQTSVAALQAALSLLKTGGVLIAVLYHGHEAGKPELQAVSDFAQALPQPAFRVLRYEFINQKNCPPIVLAIEKTE